MASKTLLIVAHVPSPNTKKLAQAAYDGANHPDIDINVILKAPQDTQPEDVLAADALLLGTTENLAYMAGLTKDFFDRCYYQVLEKKQGMPFALYIRAGHDGTGTKLAMQTITLQSNPCLSSQSYEPLLYYRSWLILTKIISMALIAKTITDA